LERRFGAHKNGGASSGRAAVFQLQNRLVFILILWFHRIYFFVHTSPTFVNLHNNKHTTDIN
jgi:hypothetical protein